MSSITEQVGRVIGGRYRLLAAVGSGASAQVFAADDARLSRRVAVKLLHPGLAGDGMFLRKFQAEARLAASLNHPNVLHVYDWGDEEQVPYLVLEYLGGGSLRSMLDTGARLSPAQATAIGAQAAHGLAYAHRRGLVHRDVKPANLLFNDDGRLLVADFGLARALAEAAITEPLGMMLGTARYASPEQVEGRPIDDRADVYALALTLYEAVTGRVPFVGDSAAATLMARVGAILPPARELGPLAPVLAQAAISEPLARLDAAGLAVELDLLAQELPPPGPLPLSRIDLGLSRPEVGVDRDPTEPFGSRFSSPVASPLPPPVATAAPPGTSSGREHLAAAPSAAPAGLTVVRRIDPGSTEASVAAPGAPGSSQGPGPSPPRRKRRLVRWLAVLVVLVLLAGAGAFAVVRFVVYGHVVPKVKGITLAVASREVRAAGLRLVVSHTQYDLAFAAGTVISQYPPAGTRERSGTPVRVVESLGVQPVALPRLAKLDRAQAVAALTKSHLRAHVAAPVYSETVPSGQMASWSPKGPMLLWGTTVNLVLSKGPKPRTIPSSVVGAPYTQAEQQLAAVQLGTHFTYQYSSTVNNGYVVTTSPAPGQQVARGTSVDVVVSLGPPLVRIPFVANDSVTKATQILESYGFKVAEYGPNILGEIYAIYPSQGKLVPPGTTIDLYTL